MKLPNIVVRILAGAVFVGLLIAGMLLNQYTYLVLFCLITALSLKEFYGLVQNNAGVSLSKTLNIVGGMLLVGSFFLYCSPFHNTIGFSIYLLYLIALFVCELYRKRTEPLESLAYAALGQIYIALPFALTSCLVFGQTEDGAYSHVLLLAVFAFIWVNDSFAYLTGMAFGKHRLFERISPKKSWEGFFGGAIFAMASSYLFYLYTDFLSLGTWIGFALVVVIFGTWGDLVESLMKRTLKVKDSGNTIPGHGGLLDRFDSTILAIPAAVVYLEIIDCINKYIL